MARTALFHLLRSQSKQLISRNIHSGSLFLYLGTPPSVLFFIPFRSLLLCETKSLLASSVVIASWLKTEQKGDGFELLYDRVLEKDQ
ncbi:hypothetical protein Gogos_005142 [Gossypium gossypioides]|uniref:Uncharacterized protein n=1 Tax=Gossypium gossypioides TaxID=34282 RepID=A0A7J9CIH0_GOSGO|nr:hypothetical protein [Gossypium gossypioides]